MAAPAPRCTLLPLSAQRVMPWKNGGGSTREIAIEPAAATVADGFRWRLSRASVAADGPFSPFPGIDRTLWLARGAGIELAIDGAVVRLAEPWQRVDFAGEATVHGRLLGGPIEDLNLMVRRADTTASADVVRLRAGERISAALPRGTTVVAALGGGVNAHGRALAVGDALRLDAEVAGTLALAAERADAAALVAHFARR